MKSEHVLLTLSQEPLPFISPRRSLWRSWKSLSRLQRQLIILLTLICILIITLHILKADKHQSDYKGSTIPQTIIPDNHVYLSKINVDKEEVFSEMINEGNFNDNNEQLKPPKIIDTEEQMIIKPKKKPVIFLAPSSQRQLAVIEAFKHSWNGYKKYAWGHDHLKPISKSYHDWFGLGLTIVDSLDTMYIMNLKEEFNDGREWVATRLKLNEFNDVNLFEVTIRVLGGLLSAYHFSADDMFLNKALDLGERLLPCFTRSPSAIPYSDVNLASHIAHSPRWGPDSSTSEVTTLQLEFRDLSRSAGNNKFEIAGAKVSEHVHKLEKIDGLVPVFINPRTGQFQSYSDIKLGARGDSYYEYLLKQWIQTGKTQNYLIEDYKLAINGIQKHLVKETEKEKLVFIGELKGGDTKEFISKMDHLVCYLPGTLALGYHYGLPKDHLKLAENLMSTCYRTYTDRPTKLAPEITYFALQTESPHDMYVKTGDSHNLLRPEFIESLWYMYQITGNKTYQEWGWNIFKSFEKYTKVPNGYTSIGNVNAPDDVRPRDMMESFFLSETLKYFYLLFADDRKLIDIDKYVINTEAHPLPIYKS